MATTTNYGWTTPDDTALVKDGAAAIRTLGSSVDTTTKALNPSTTLGDIEYRSSTANTNTRLGIGSTGNVLTVTGGVPTWSPPAGGGKLLQLVTANLTTATTIASTSMTDTGLTATITPTLATSKIWVVITCPFWMVRSDSVMGVGFNLLRGATLIREQDASGQTFWHNYSGVTSAQTVSNFALNYLDSPATTSATTYKVQARVWATSSSGSVSVPHANTPVTAAVITLLEIGA
jgi:hypothetical protein